MTDERVTVVIPHFNRSVLLHEAVESIREPEGVDVEIVIVDDGSTPEELAAIADLGDSARILTRTDGPKGPSHCRNIGATAGTGNFLLFLDSDDLLAPGCIAGRLRQALAQPDADLWVFPAMTFQQSPSDGRFLWNRMDDGTPAARRFMASDPPWHTSSPLWRRGSFLAIGGFNEKIFYGDDADLHMRALLSGLTARLFPDREADVFVRRSATRRITNDLATNAWDVRRARLSEGTIFLLSLADPELLRLWQAQYFREAEWFLFNADSTADVDAVLHQWRVDFPRDRLLSARVKAYFELAKLTRRRAYPLLRLARRAAMLSMPGDFFRTAPSFQGEVKSSPRESMTGS